MTVPTTTTATTGAKPTFLYDDCCPLCRTYTATFSALGWADRAAFSGIDTTTLDALDMDVARHHIPLHDPATGATHYGLDGILGVVRAEAPRLGAIGSHDALRPLLDRLYWFITYNRRHIVAAPPPAEGVDCAPDFAPAAVKAYLGFCVAAATALAAAAGPAAVGGAALAGTALVANRDGRRDINSLQAAGHAGSITIAAGLAGALAKAVTGRADLALAAAAITTTRKIFLRRWMLSAPGDAD